MKFREMDEAPSIKEWADMHCIDDYDEEFYEAYPGRTRWGYGEESYNEISEWENDMFQFRQSDFL